jgi:TolB-like protein/Tfp pilus assembly protein PilF
MKLFEELKRRNVIKATMAYIVIAWVLIQVLTIILPIFQAPTWALKTLMILMVIGLPIWVIFSWVYDVTPEGLKKTEKTSTDESVTATTNKRLNIIIVVMLLIAIGVNFIDSSGSEASNKLSSAEPSIENSIAVLPFKDMSPDKDQEYFSDGIAIEIIDALCKFQDLRVIGNTSSFSFKDKNDDLINIGDQLNANTILEGSVRRQLDQIMISVRLTDAKNGFVIFSASYDDDLENIFVLQQKIAIDVVGKIESNLGLNTKSQLASKKINPLAFENYLKGKLIRVNGPLNLVEDEVLVPKKYFEKAVKLDPGFAEAWAYLALSYFNETDWVEADMEKIKMARDSAMTMAKRAFSLDSLNSAVHLAMGSYYFHQFDWVKAEKEKRKAVSLNPGGADEKYALASFLSGFGQVDEALLLVQEAIDSDPLNEIKGKKELAKNLFLSARYDECIAYCQQLLEENPNSPAADQFLYISYFMKGEIEKGQKVLAHFIETHDKEKEVAAFFKENDFETAVEKLFAYGKETKQLQRSFYKASFYAWVKDKDNTIKYLNETFDNKEAWISFLTDDRFDFIKDDPRYWQLYEKAGFNIYDDYLKKKKEMQKPS